MKKDRTSTNIRVIIEKNCDLQIKSLIKKNDPHALTLIYDQYADGLYGYLINFFGIEDDAKEVLQRVFLKIVEHKQRLLKVNQIRNYLFIITRNEAISYLRESERYIKSIKEWETFFVPWSESDELSPDDTREIARALGKLPNDQREVIYLKIYENLTFDAIAKVLGISPNTIASRYRYGMDKLRKHLNGSFKSGI